MYKYLLLILSLISIPAFIIKCGQTINKSEKNYISADEISLGLLKNIERINAGAPQSFTAEFNIDGHSGKQKFKSEGTAQFNSNPRKMRLVFHDAVFKSPITEIIQDGDKIKLYFPFDKILYIDNVNTINLKSYSNVDLDYNIVSDLSTGKIPLIKKYTVKKTLENKTDSGPDDNKLIILENEEYYETISFNRSLPDRILWLNKNTKYKLEVYLKDPVILDEAVFYKMIRVLSKDSDLNFTIQFNSLNLNQAVDIEKIVKLNFPPDGKIINRD